VTRRQLINSLVWLSSSYTISKISILPNNNFANKSHKEPHRFLEPFTCITIGISVAKLFAGMFQSNEGPDISDFINNLKDQLGIITQKIDILARDIIDLRKRIDNLPQDATLFLYKTKMRARIDDYKSIMIELGLQQSYDGDIEKYMSKNTNKAKIQRLVAEIKDINSTLRQIDDVSIVPFIAMGIHIDIYLRNNFLNEEWKDFIGDIVLNRNYIHKQMYSGENCLEKILKSQQSDRLSLRESITDRVTTKFDTYVSSGGSAFIVYNRKLMIVYKKPVVDSEVKEPMEVKNLRSIGLLDRYDAPLKFVVDKKELIDIQATTVDFDSTAGDFQDRLDKRASEMLSRSNEKIELNYYRVVATASAFMSGFKAIEFCDVYINTHVK
jgi:hypothetical protein